MSQLHARLESGVAELGLSLGAVEQQQLLQYLEEMLAWNRRINLTAITDPQQALIQHLLDSLAVAPHLGAGPVLDVGSGGGLPSLPLAVLRPDVAFTSIDSRNKKIAFQRHAARLLQLSNHHAVCGRVEQWQPEAPFVQVISRAFASLRDFAELAGRHLVAGGELLAMKGRKPVEEMQQMPRGWQLVKMVRLTVPGLAAERHLLVYRREPA